MISPLVEMPWRIPVDADLDVITPLREWLDWCESIQAEQQQEFEENDGDGEIAILNDDFPQLTADECQPDLERLQDLRRQVAAGLHTLANQTQIMQPAPELIKQWQDYAAVLHIFLQNRFLLPPAASSNHHANSRNHPDEQQQDDGSFQSPLCLRWKTLGTATRNNHNDNSMDLYGSLEWERANIIWNLAAWQAREARTGKNFTKKIGWMKAGENLCFAAAMLRQIRSVELYPELAAENNPGETTTTPAPLPWAGVALQAATLHLWEQVLLAEAQRAGYEALRTLPRPRHFLLANFAAAAKPMYEQVYHTSSSAQQEFQAMIMMMASGSSGSQSSKNSNAILDDTLMSRLDEWKAFGKAWALWVSATAEYHQAVAHHEKSEWGLELARLSAALAESQQCQEWCAQCESVRPSEPSQFGIQFSLEQDMKQRKAEAEDENSGRIPGRNELPEIPSKPAVNTSPNLSKLLPPYAGPAFFANAMDDITRQYVQGFRQEMEEWVFESAQISEEKTENGRKALATVNLPHSLTAYRQELNGGGLPEDLWSRVEQVQRERRDTRVKHELWELRDLAETARNTYRRLLQQLDEDIQMDALFREQNPEFQGPNVAEIQNPFRVTLQKYDRTIAAADESDTLLLQSCEALDSDSKFRLLSCSRSQLDRLLPAAQRGAREIDISGLSRHLVELSDVFGERDELLHQFRETVKAYNIVPELQQIAADMPDPRDRISAFDMAVGQAKGTLARGMHDLEESIQRQDKLLDIIVQENERFMQARMAQRSSHSSPAENEKLIVNIEDALEELEQFSSHLREGRVFYDMIIPKLDRLKQQVEDVSARLTVERCEYEDNLRRSRQEEEDAKFAASMGPSKEPAEEEPAVGPDGKPIVRVDDEKVASLVAMDFEPDKVVEALRKHDNDVDRALNELLG